MSPQIFFIIGVACMGIALVGGVLWWHNIKETGFSDTDMVQIAFPHGTVTAEIAASPAKQSHGLSGRTELAPLHGMLFAFPSPQKQTFWMKGMKISLDFVWLSNNQVVDIKPDVQPPQNTFDFNLIAPSQPANLVLEVPSGTIQSLDIKLGDVIQIKKDN